MSYKSSSKKTVTSSGEPGSGMCIDTELGKMHVSLDQQMKRMKEEMFQLMPLGPSSAASQLIKLDDKALQSFIDDAHKDRFKIDLDVHEFKSESVVVKQDGNKIEVHAKKLVKTGDDEQTEEYSRTYELPGTTVDTKAITSSLQKDGNILTIELPMVSGLTVDLGQA